MLIGLGFFSPHREYISELRLQKVKTAFFFRMSREKKRSKTEKGVVTICMKEVFDLLLWLFFF